METECFLLDNVYVVRDIFRILTPYNVKFASVHAIHARRLLNNAPHVTRFTEDRLMKTKIAPVHPVTSRIQTKICFAVCVILFVAHVQVLSKQTA
jgi:hypothetical protein